MNKAAKKPRPEDFSSVVTDCDLGINSLSSSTVENWSENCLSGNEIGDVGEILEGYASLVQV